MQKTGKVPSRVAAVWWTGVVAGFGVGVVLLALPRTPSAASLGGIASFLFIATLSVIFGTALGVHYARMSDENYTARATKAGKKA